MNERIDQLLVKAGAYFGGEGVVYDRFDPKRFAELIVQECLNQCYNRGMDDELYAGQLKAATYIEEYFGVENES